jgi:hypothetical protein
MKTQEQQKADLLDELMHRCTGAFSRSYGGELLLETLNKYRKITAQKPLTADPYADEIFSGRLCRFLAHYFFGDTTELRLSECPKIDLINTERGFGRKSREEYIEVMTTYEMWDKI